MAREYGWIMDKETDEQYAERIGSLRKIYKVMDFLEIPYDFEYDGDEGMNVRDLYDILMDDEKLRVLVSKLRNKAFW